jgi:hypothetical protein
MEAEGSRIRLIVDDSAAQYPFVVDPMWSQQQKLTGGDAGGFGWSLAVDGDTAVVGAFQKTVNSNFGQGSAYVFVRSGTSWSLQQELTASDGQEDDWFGYSVAVKGNTVVIGAYHANIGSNRFQGATYVFVRAGAMWNQQQKLTATNGLPFDTFGLGAAYVFVRSGTTWSQQQELTPFGGSFGKGFGYCVALSGDTAVVGAFGESVGNMFQREVAAADRAVNRRK